LTTIDPASTPPARFADDDVEQLRLLSVFHYVVAGIMALVALFPTLYLVLGVLMAFGRLAPEDDGSRIVGWLMATCGSFFMIAGLSFAATIAVAGRSLAQHRRYTFCLVVAALLCLFVPFGTLLGIFTIIVLVRSSVRARFLARAQ
jgi:fumarate reductase subunit D